MTDYNHAYRYFLIELAAYRTWWSAPVRPRKPVASLSRFRWLVGLTLALEAILGLWVASGGSFRPLSTT